MIEPLRIYPHSGICARCRRERDDLFWHRFDETFYCADVFRCEVRYLLQGERASRRSLPGALPQALQVQSRVGGGK